MAARRGRPPGLLRTLQNVNCSDLPAEDSSEMLKGGPVEDCEVGIAIGFSTPGKLLSAFYMMALVSEHNIHGQQKRMLEKKEEEIYIFDQEELRTQPLIIDWATSSGEQEQEQPLHRATTH
jgi:hypothetical protein